MAKKLQLPEIPKPILEVGKEVQKRLLKLEKRLNSLTKWKLIILVVTVGVSSLLAGVVFGFFLTPSRATPTPVVDLTTPPTTPPPETVSQTGVLRRFQTSQNGIEFYLEKPDKTQVLLQATDRIDPSLLTSFEGLSVTVEGTVIKSADGKKDILQIEKIWIKR